MAHTPGQWETSRDAVPDYHTQITVYAQSDGERIATVFRTEDNASLIAAAPDLLEALRDLVRNMPVDAINISGPLRAARAAVARAEGK